MRSRTLRILRAAERPPTPWKNGGGLTREVIVHPPGSDLSRFDWRVSLAEIRAPGPFSSLPGIDRRMAVLEGRLSLSIGEGAGMIATPETPPLRRSEEHTSELQSRVDLVCRLLLEKKKRTHTSGLLCIYNRST